MLWASYNRDGYVETIVRSRSGTLQARGNNSILWSAGIAGTGRYSKRLQVNGCLCCIIPSANRRRACIFTRWKTRVIRSAWFASGRIWMEESLISKRGFSFSPAPRLVSGVGSRRLSGLIGACRRQLQNAGPISRSSHNLLRRHGGGSSRRRTTSTALRRGSGCTIHTSSGCGIR